MPKATLQILDVLKTLKMRQLRPAPGKETPSLKARQKDVLSS